MSAQIMPKSLRRRDYYVTYRIERVELVKTPFFYRRDQTSVQNLTP